MRVARNETREALIAELQRAVQAADPGAFLVPARIVRRVIRRDHELPRLGLHLPHRKSYLLSREHLLEVVAHDELGLRAGAPLPRQVILLARPSDDELERFSRPELLRAAWRLLFHARVHLELHERQAAGGLSLPEVRRRIHALGQAEFDEAQAVLRQEHFLFPDAGVVEAYIEFVAVFLELLHFAPHWLPAYFPSLNRQAPRVAELLGADVDADLLLARTRLAEAAVPAVVLPRASAESAVELKVPPAATLASRRNVDKLVVSATRAAERGNSVRAAIRLSRAASLSGESASAQELADRGRAELDRLTGRLEAALGFDTAAGEEWARVLGALLESARDGFWTPEARLLFDLQKVCVDHERVVHEVDLVGWIASLGRRPLKRALPNQREVLMSKHLRSAAGRLTSVRLAGRDRSELESLLRSAARAAERQLRHRLRPLVSQSLDDVGLVPANLPERVAAHKVVEELLDGVVERGFLTMGYVRDCLSRNNLKLADLSGPRELLRGDRLLRVDSRLAELLDGVYQRGDFFLRWLQMLSSIGFGTATGRFLTLYVLMPFGGAYVVLEGLEHLVHEVSSHLLDAPVHLLPPHAPLNRGLATCALGLVLLGLMHHAGFRAVVLHVLRRGWGALRAGLVHFPRWLVRFARLKEIWSSRPAVWVRRFVVNPALLTGLVYVLLSAAGYRQRPTPLALTLLFATWNLILNSRVGRDMEEAAAESLERMWYLVHARIFVALYEVVMETFKRILEGLERLLYAVDEWLRFKSGETSLALGMKAVLGLAWSVVAFVVRFCVTLLVEPQINPIKHFPVVTVSHKIILPTQPFLASLLRQPLGTVWANALAGAIVFLLPGVFGFLVWELKENWRLYAANRPRFLSPVRVGSHGETLIRLMKPGFHSGTLPKLYARLRRATRKSRVQGRRRKLARYEERLRHLREAVRSFLEREFATLLEQSRGWGGRAVEVGTVELASNGMRIEILSPDFGGQGVWLSLEEQSGWLVAGIANTGWLRLLDEVELRTFRAALLGLYKLGGVDLVQEQIEAAFEPHAPAWDIGEQGLIVWPGGGYAFEVVYNLRDDPLLVPHPELEALAWELPELPATLVLFGRSRISWEQWVEVWSRDAAGLELPPLLENEGVLLDTLQRVPLAGDG